MVEDIFVESSSLSLSLSLSLFLKLNMVSELGSGETNSPIAAMEGSSLSSVTSFNPVTFNNSLTLRLDNENYLIWRKQVFSAIKGHKLQDYVLGTKSPPKKFSSPEDEESGNVNQNFINWEQQDQLLVSWLLSGMSESVLSRMISCETSAQVWSTLEIYFASQIRAKISQYKTQLKNTRKDSLTMNDFLLKIRRVVDLLNLVGEKLTVKEHVEAIFEGLDDEYENFMINFDMQNKLVSVEEVEALLLSQEARIDRKHQRQLDGSQSQLQANLAGHGQSDKKKFSQSSSPNSSYSGFSTSGNRGGRFNGGGRGRFNGRGRGRSSWNNNKPQCQLCGKFGHVALQCYYRFDQSFFGPSQLSNQFGQS